MDYQRFGNDIVLRLNPGEEIIESIRVLSLAENIQLGTVQGIGACGEVTFGFYHLDEQRYQTIDKNEDLELTSLMGNITTMNGEHYSHLHVNFGDANGNIIGGHLNKGIVSATAELFIHVINGKVNRQKEEKTGINCLELNLEEDAS